MKTQWTTAVVLVMALAIAVRGADSPATAPSIQTPRATIQKVLDDVLAVLRNSKLSKQERSKEVEKIADANMDFDTLAKLSLGAPWRTINDAQKKSFSDE